MMVRGVAGQRTVWLFATGLACALALGGCEAILGTGSLGDRAGDGGQEPSQGSTAGSTSSGAGSSGGGSGSGSGGDTDSATNNTGASSGATSGSSSGSGSSTGSGATSGNSSGSGSSTRMDSGTTSGSSSGSASSSGSSSGSGSTGTDAGSADSEAGGAGNASPTFSASDAGDLTSPAAGTGFELVTPDQSVAPNEEVFYCYYVTLPNTSEVEVGLIQSWTSGSSVYEFELLQGGTAQPSGTWTPCSTMPATNPLFEAPTSGSFIMRMPAGVGYPLAASTQLVLFAHFINTGTTTVSPKVKINLVYQTSVQYKAAMMQAFNTGINVPPGTPMNPGTVTVSGTCSASTGSNFFLMTTHTFKHATSANIQIVRGGQPTEVVHTGATTSYPADQQPGTGTAWSNPGVGAWTSPTFLTTGAGDSFAYHCSYENMGNTAVTVGSSFANNEICEAVGFYFPAATATCQ